MYAKHNQGSVSCKANEAKIFNKPSVSSALTCCHAFSGIQLHEVKLQGMRTKG